VDIKTALEKIVGGEDLSQQESAAVFRLIMSGEATPAQIGAFLAAIRVKGESAAELAGAAEKATSQCVMIGDNWTDICGGRNAGMPTCAVAWGFGDPVKLYDAEPQFIAESPADLVTLFG